MLRYAAVFGILVVLSGCDRLSSAFMSAPTKINQAYPIAPELGLAQAQLLAADAADTSSKHGISEALEQLMVLRALTCAGSTTISRFDTVEATKEKIHGTDCFKKQDLQIAEWIGLRRVGILLRQPALRPLADLPPELSISGSRNTTWMTAATAANIALVQDDRKALTLLDVGNGQSINSLELPAEAYRWGKLSPNGRLLGVPISNNRFTVYDTEKGSPLWHSKRFNELIAWLPEVNGLVMYDGQTGSTALVDLQTGQMQPHPITEINLTWSQAVPQEYDQRWIGGSQGAWLVEHTRRAGGQLVASVKKQWRFQSQGVTSSSTWLMRNGSLLVYLSSMDLGWLDLRTGQQGVWAFSALDGYGFSKLDESNIVYTQRARNNKPAALMMLDVANQVVSTVSDADPEGGAWLTLAPRNGYAKRFNDTLLVRSSFETRAPQALETLLARADLDRQLAKLQNVSTTQTGVASGSNAAAVEAAIAAIRASAAAQGIVLPSSPSAPADHPKPLLGHIPSNAKVAAIGVYQARTAGTRAIQANGERPAGVVRVNVAPGSTPLVLVLSSYEPVRWLVDNSNGRTISAVLLSGYHPSSVIGAVPAEVLKIGDGYAYQMGSPEYERLKTSVSRYVANPITSFQGSYEGQDFQVRN